MTFTVRVLAALAVFAFCSPTWARDVAQFTAAEAGVTAAALFDADGVDVPAEMAPQAHDAGRFNNQAKLKLAVTFGTSVDFDGRCYEGPTDVTATHALMATCSQSGGKEVCTPKVWNWTAAAWPLGEINFRVPVTDRFYYCEFWHTAAGNGTITVTGAKSRQ